MISIILIVLSVMVVISAILAIQLKDMVSSIIAAGAVSLLASVLYLIYGAPDVAMTEASIGSALTTVVFLFAWFRVKNVEKEKKEEKND
ncbi:MAG: DUF4040 domain-containing protein [Spirochaetaceae bacterium]